MDAGRMREVRERCWKVREVLDGCREVRERCWKVREVLDGCWMDAGWMLDG